jgi:hypothetical protein
MLLVWNTGSSSPGELLVTFKTSEVATGCSAANHRRGGCGISL